MPEGNWETIGQAILFFAMAVGSVIAALKGEKKSNGQPPENRELRKNEIVKLLEGLEIKLSDGFAKIAEALQRIESSETQGEFDSREIRSLLNELRTYIRDVDTKLNQKG